MTYQVVRRAAFTLAGAAAATALAAPVHADVTANNVTVVGTNFQVGQTYTVTYSGPGAEIMDTVNGVVIDEGSDYSWNPESPGTHQISVGTRTLDGSEPTPTAGPVTVVVTGTGIHGSDPTACGISTASGCMTLHGTPEVGCTLTVDMFPNPTNAVQPNPLSATVGGIVAPSVLTDNGVQVPAPIQPTIGGTTTVHWTPTTSGVHTLTNHFSPGALTLGSPSGNPSQSGTPVAALISGSVAEPGSTGAGEAGGTIWVPVAPAGTTPCSA